MDFLSFVNAMIILENIKNIYMNFIPFVNIMIKLDGTGNCNLPSPRKTEPSLSWIVNNMITDDLVTQEARTSVAIVAANIFSVVYSQQINVGQVRPKYSGFIIRRVNVWWW